MRWRRITACILICLLASGGFSFAAPGDTVAQPPVHTATPSDADTDLLTGRNPEADRELRPVFAAAATPSQADIPVVRVDYPYRSMLYLLEKEGDVKALLDSDPVISQAIGYAEDGRIRQPLSIEYDVSSLDTDVTGLVFLKGYVKPPEGYTIDEETAAISLALFIYNQENETVFPAKSYIGAPQPLARVYTTDNTLEDFLYDVRWSNSLVYIIDGGFQCTLPAQWNTDGIRMETPGTYDAVLSPRPPEGLIMPEELVSFTTPVTVQTPGAFLLTAPIWYRSSPMFLWQEEVTPNSDFLKLWTAVQDGPWAADVEDYVLTLRPGSLVLSEPDLKLGTDYYFQMEYDGQLSNVIRFRREKEQILFDDLGGDRDAVDRTPQKPPNIVQPAPDETKPALDETKPAPDETKPAPDKSESSSDGGGHNRPSHSSGGNRDDSSSTHAVSASDSAPGTPPDNSVPMEADSGGLLKEPENGTVPESDAVPAGISGLKQTESKPSFVLNGEESSAPSPVLEEDTLDKTTWSKTRLLDYIRVNPEKPVIFEKHGIRLSIPAPDAKALAESGDSLTVLIQKPDGILVHMEFSVDGSPLKIIPAVSLFIPYTPESPESALRIVAPDGSTVKDAVYDDLAGGITFTASQNGSYLLAEQYPPDLTGTGKPVSHLLQFLLSGIGIAAALIFIRKQINN